MLYRFYEDLEIGQEFTSPGRTVTEADVVIFAGLSGDYNALHTDEEYMKGTVFGTRIAHGWLGPVIQSGLAPRAISPPVKTFAFLGIKEWTFHRPIFIGDTLTLHLKVHDKRETSKSDRGIVHWHSTLKNQRGEIAQQGIVLSMIHRRPQPS